MPLTAAILVSPTLLTSLLLDPSWRLSDLQVCAKSFTSFYCVAGFWRIAFSPRPGSLNTCPSHSAGGTIPAPRMRVPFLVTPVLHQSLRIPAIGSSYDWVLDFYPPIAESTYGFPLVDTRHGGPKMCERVGKTRKRTDKGRKRKEKGKRQVRPYLAPKESTLAPVKLGVEILLNSCFPRCIDPSCQ